MTKHDCYFLLKEPNSTEPTLIYFFLQCPDGKVKRSVQRQINPSDWDFEAKRPQKDRELDRYLDTFVQMEEDIKSDCRRNKTIITKSKVDDAIDILLQDSRPDRPKKAPKEEVRNMIDDFRTITDGMAAGTILTPGKQKKKYEPKSITYFKRVINTLEEFFKDESLAPHYENITLDTYNRHIAWSHKKNFANSYIGNTIKGWKRLAAIANDEKQWHSNRVFDSDDFVKITEETDDIALTEKEIERIYRVEVEESHYDLARDWFVLDCFMGLRVSDLLAISERDFEGDYFEFVNKKTGAQVALPVHPFVREVIKKYGGIPPKISDVKLNKYIKEVAKKAKLNSTFIYTITKGGRLQTIRCKKWEMVSSHTCRRSFITILLKLGLAHAKVMRLAGIKRYQTLMRYFKQTPKEVAEDVSSHAFFTGSQQSTTPQSPI